MSEDEEWVIVEELCNGNKIIKCNSRYGIINKKNEIICDIKFLIIYKFSERILVVKSDPTSHGLYDIHGRIISECKYREIGKLENGFARVEIREEGWRSRSNLLNRFGMEVFPTTFKSVCLTDKYIIVKEEYWDIESLIDYELNIIFDFDKGYSDIRVLENGYYIVNIRGLDELINIDGTVISSYSMSTDKSRKFFRIDGNLIRSNNYWRDGSPLHDSYFNFSGVEFDEILNLVESRRVARYAISRNGVWDDFTDGKYVYLDENGEVVIPDVFDEADNFINGKALVNKSGKYFFIDKDGLKIKDVCQYQSIERYKGVFAVVQLSGLYGVIDSNGEEVVNCQYNYLRIEELNNGSYLIGNDESTGYLKYGLMNSKGEKVLPCIYDSIGNFYNERAYIGKDRKYGYVDNECNIVIPCIYDEVENFHCDDDDDSDIVQVRIGLRIIGIDKCGNVVEEYSDNGGYDDEYTDSELRDMTNAAYRGE